MKKISGVLITQSKYLGFPMICYFLVSLNMFSFIQCETNRGNKCFWGRMLLIICCILSEKEPIDVIIINVILAPKSYGKYVTHILGNIHNYAK